MATLPGASHHLGDYPIDQFLARFWQQQPLYIKGALGDWAVPIDAGHLAGLACEPEAESRLVSGPYADGGWKVCHGPFAESDFTDPPEVPWTLLVQGVDKLIPDFDTLIERFRFLPDWRLDDLMISYAVTGGSVGPHCDEYDVFLIQAAGRRQWQIDAGVSRQAELVPDLALRILRNFTPQEGWILEPGDALYLPPGVAHHGVALDDTCMTLSVGFRSPSWAELMSGFGDALLELATGSSRYTDEGAEPTPHPGTLAVEVRRRIRAEITDLLLRHADAFDQWLGRYLTEPKINLAPHGCKQPVAWRGEHGHFRRNQSSRLIFAASEDGTGGWLFADGEQHTLAKALLDGAEFLADHRVFRFQDLPRNSDEVALANLLDALLESGSLEWVDDSE